MGKTDNDHTMKRFFDLSKDAGKPAAIVNEDSLDIIQSFLDYAKSRDITLEHHDLSHEINAGYVKKELLQVYFDLLSKAFAYQSGSRNISLRVAFDNISNDASDARSTEPNDRPIIVSVTGMEISADDLSELFYWFCHSESKRITRAELKSEFSLTTVVIDLSGGSIRIENRKSADGSQAWAGTNFILILHGHIDRTSADQASLQFDSRVVIENDVLNGRNKWSREADVTYDKLKLRYEQVVNLERPDANDNPDDKFLCKLMALLESNISDPEFNVSKLVNEIGMSRPVLFRKAKILTGSSIINLIRSRRLKMAEMLLKQNKVAVSEVAFKVGYNDPKYFSKSFRSEYGKTPTEFVHALRS